MFPDFKPDILYALDLDGVLIDSIEECYQICVITFQGEDFCNKEEKELFYKYRGLVQPAHEFYYLMLSIKVCLKKHACKVDQLFAGYKKNARTVEADHFEKQFFQNRRRLQEKDLKNWRALNPLTAFGKHVQKEKPKNMVIITTKNTDSAKAIIEYHKIYPRKIYGNDHVKDAGSKGKLLNAILEKSPLKRMIFIDDATEHLNTVDNKNIRCYFAGWGYGEKNNDYISY